MAQCATQLQLSPKPQPQDENPIAEQQRLPIRQQDSPTPELLPQNEQLYISSILFNTFSSDAILLSGPCENLERRALRVMLVQQYLALNAHQYVFFTAFFYLEKYLNLKPEPRISSNLLTIACLALARKYQKGKAPNLDTWKQKLGLTFENQQVRDIEDEIIQILQFELQPMTRFNFMSDLFLKIKLTEKHMHFSSYLLDLSALLTHVENQDGINPFFSQAEIGLSVVRLTCYFFNPDLLSNLPINEFGYSMQRIHECCSCLFQLLMNRKLSVLRPIRHRYRRTKFMEVSKIQFFKIEKVGAEKAGSEKETADENEEERDMGGKGSIGDSANC